MSSQNNQKWGKTKNIRVPDHDIKIRLHELIFVHTNTFQRLQYIRQLGLAYLVYPFATHTRAAHSFDCLHMAQQFIDHLKYNIGIPEDDEKKNILKRLEDDTECIRASALLHDITHIPFSHALEDENNILQRHDKSTRVNKILEKLKQEIKELDLESYRTFSFNTREDFEKAIEKCEKVLNDVKKVLWTIALHEEIDGLIESMLKESRDKPSKIYDQVKKRIEEKYKQENVEVLEADRYYIADIIGNTISSDLLSYVLRDPVMAGTEEKPGGWYRLFDYIDIIRDNGGRRRLTIKITQEGELRLDVISTIIRILNARYEITELINYHHAKVCADAMLGKIAQFCNISESEDLYGIGDEGFLNLLEQRIKNGELLKVEGWNKDHIRRGAENLLKNLRSRRFHKRFHEIKNPFSKGYDLSAIYKDPEKRLMLEKSIIDEFNLIPGQIIIFCPERKLAMKEACTLVTFEEMCLDGSLKPITIPLNNRECKEYLEREIGKTIVSRIEDVETQYKELWKLYVFVDPSIIPVFGYAIKERLEEELGPCKPFDKSYLEPLKAYQVSKRLKKNVEKRVPRDKVKEVLIRIPFRKIPRDVSFVNYLEEYMDKLVEEAISAMDSQKKLEGYIK